LCRQNILETTQQPRPSAFDQMRENTRQSSNSILRNSIQQIFENLISPPSSQGTIFAPERNGETGSLEEVD
jgi:hypothetical protein